ncbi:hypothetical protein GGR54DRAFT_485040 [Hypoxylon sp. NC1633]|nr:hypothetical protein GGR54DRAFT_485040 [Hypoxylon sp. NC1633]
MADDENPSCAIAGNPDLYGLGVRLGLYLQFIALVLARPSVRLAFKAINSSTIAFILANFIVLVRESSKETLKAPEAYLLFFLLVPQLTVNAIGSDLWRGSPDPRGFIAVLLWGAFCGYYTWFWWIGLDVIPIAGCGEEYGFFFTKVSLRGWFRTFNKAIWVISDIALGVLILSLPVQLLIWYSMRREIREAQRVHEAQQVPRPRGERFRINNIIQHIVLQFWSFLPFIIFVTGAEVTIRYNNIEGVNTVDTASQLVPLVLALGLLAHIIAKTTMKFVHGFRHAFDEVATEDGEDDDFNDARRELMEERGWLGAIGRFLFRVYGAFSVGYNEVEEEEPTSSGPGSGCPKNTQYTTVEVELEGGARA